MGEYVQYLAALQEQRRRGGVPLVKIGSEAVNSAPAVAYGNPFEKGLGAARLLNTGANAVGYQNPYVSGGLNAAGSAYGLATGNNFQKGVAGADLARQGAGYAGYNLPPGMNSAANAGLGAAALGYNIYQLANAEGLSNKQKAGQSGKLVADTVLSATVPFYGLARAAQAVGSQLQKSGSPQLRGLGRSIDYAAEPAGGKAFMDVATGMRSPRDAIKAQGGFQGAMLDTMGPVGLIMRGIGADLPLMNQVPTKGAQFEKSLYKLMNFNKFLGTGEKFRTQNIGRTGLTPEELSGITPEAQRLAGALGPALALMAGSGRTPQLSPAYQQRAQNLLLRNYGSNLTSIAPQLYQKMGATDAEQARQLAMRMKMSPEQTAAFLAGGGYS